MAIFRLVFRFLYLKPSIFFGFGVGCGLRFFLFFGVQPKYNRCFGGFWFFLFVLFGFRSASSIIKYTPQPRARAKTLPRREFSNSLQTQTSLIQPFVALDKVLQRK